MPTPTFDSACGAPEPADKGEGFGKVSEVDITIDTLADRS
jgi:hypothetical protein